MKTELDVPRPTLLQVSSEGVLIQPSMFRGVPEKVLTPEAERERERLRRNRIDRERCAKKAHR
jgi:hypothetical protein